MRGVVGLGNPGEEYADTRHNVGFDVVRLLAGRHRIDLGRVRHRARFGLGTIAGERVLLALPLTYMNLSGEAVRPLLAYHGLGPADLVVVHDEADLEPGTVRVKSGGGTAGHNGVTSIADHLGTTDFVRVRIGIGRPRGGVGELVDHVLRRPGREEAELLAAARERGADAVEALLREGLERAMNKFNRREPAP
ncbi:MAG: aminoacyl-tRNA hydrolase [Acidobacteria bacterium]|nr:aminoacyl-tRNA hydrolase [Acidobacteriota bacterium]